VFNRYAAGWVPDEDVEVHGDEGDLYDLAPIGVDGTQMVVLSTSDSERYFTIEARADSPFLGAGDLRPGAENTGVLLHVIDQVSGACGNDLCWGDTPWKTMMAQGTPWTFDHVLGVGESATVEGVPIRVVSLNADWDVHCGGGRGARAARAGGPGRARGCGGHAGGDRAVVHGLKSAGLTWSTAATPSHESPPTGSRRGQTLEAVTSTDRAGTPDVLEAPRQESRERGATMPRRCEMPTRLPGIRGRCRGTRETSRSGTSATTTASGRDHGLGMVAGVQREREPG
jgi:hypothetical protein